MHVHEHTHTKIPTSVCHTFAYMCEHIQMCHTYALMHVHMTEYVHIHPCTQHTHVCTHKYRWIHTHAYVNAHTQARKSAYIHTGTHRQVYMYMHIDTCIQTCIHTSTHTSILPDSEKKKILAEKIA